MWANGKINRSKEKVVNIGQKELITKGTGKIMQRMGEVELFILMDHIM